MPYPQREKHTSRPKGSEAHKAAASLVTGESWNAVYPISGLGLVNMWLGLALALRHDFLALYNALYILGMSHENQDFQHSLKKYKGAVWCH